MQRGEPPSGTFPSPLGERAFRRDLAKPDRMAERVRAAQLVQ